jgi:Immunoglobulin domain
LFCFVFLAGTASAQVFSDMFAGRQLLTNTTSALLAGSNTNATVEPYEPLPAGKIGGHSVWISWRAPGDGLVTLSTAGSSFDTLLAVYTLAPGADQSLPRLREDVADDDHGGLKTSYVQFGANSNETYEIAVDGFSGAAGNILLQLNFLSSANLQPTVLYNPGDESLRLGDPLILTIKLRPSPDLEYKWYLNGGPVSGQDDDSTSPTLVIPHLQETNLGFYSLKFELNDDNFFSSAIEVQVNSEGLDKVLARNKLPDAVVSGLSGGLMLGYNGTQIFNTTNAIVDTNAPAICGVAPGAAYWFSYEAPTNGFMTIDTSNSSFATLLAAFTYAGALTSYTNLIPVACDNNSDGTGTNFCQIQFNVTNGGSYFIVVGGVNGARGIAHLNYSLSAGFPAALPVLNRQPQSLFVAPRTAVALDVVAGGTPPFAYQWWKNKTRLSQQTNDTLLLRSPQNQDAGLYTVVVTNLAGSVNSAPANVSVLTAPLVRLNPASNWMISAFPGVRGYQYSVDCAAAVNGSDWMYWTNAFPDYGGVIWLTNSTAGTGPLFLRVHSP